jgi:hypothetical protein
MGALLLTIALEARRIRLSLNPSEWKSGYVLEKMHELDFSPGISLSFRREGRAYLYVHPVISIPLGGGTGD